MHLDLVLFVIYSEMHLFHMTFCFNASQLILPFLNQKASLVHTWCIHGNMYEALRFRNGKISWLASKQKVMWNKYVHVLHHFGSLCCDWHSKRTPLSHATKQDRSYPKTPHALPVEVACHRQATLCSMALSLAMGHFYTVMLFAAWNVGDMHPL